MKNISFFSLFLSACFFPTSSAMQLGGLMPLPDHPIYQSVCRFPLYNKHRAIIKESFVVNYRSGAVQQCVRDNKTGKTTYRLLSGTFEEGSTQYPSVDVLKKLYETPRPSKD